METAIEYVRPVDVDLLKILFALATWRTVIQRVLNGCPFKSFMPKYTESLLVLDYNE